MMQSVLDSVAGCYLLHSGGESSIYKVSADGKDYVLKWYRSGVSFDDDVLSTLENTHISGIYRVVQAGERDGSAFLLYDFIDGVPSGNLQKVPVPVALQALRYVANALSRLRKVDVSHGDLSPSNVIFTAVEKEGSWELQPVLIDFGIVGPGALAYAAPERFQGKQPSEKSDMFSLGLLLYRWITGEDLVVADGYEDYAAKIMAVGSEDISKKLYLNSRMTPECLGALQPLWNEMLATDPEDRVEDLDELDEILEIALDKVSGGNVTLASASQKFLQLEILPKTGTKVPPLEKCDLPYVISNPLQTKCHRKILSLVICILILCVALLLILGTRGSDIDATGEMLLKQSRSLDVESPDSAQEPVVADSLQIRNMLQDLPTPASE